MAYIQRDYQKYPNPHDEPEAEKRARLGLRDMEPDEDILSWAKNPWLPGMEPKPRTDQPKMEHPMKTSISLVIVPKSRPSTNATETNMDEATEPFSSEANHPPHHIGPGSKLSQPNSTNPSKP